MKITPIEIRQKNFEKKLRGYDKDEVTAFLMSLSNEWERVLDDNKEFRIKLDHAEKEVRKLREVESSLFRTLKTAEDTGASMVDQANKAAELHLKETQINAEAMMGEAKSKAKNLIEKAEMEAREIIEEMQDAVKDLEQNYRTLENLRENIVADLRNLCEDLVERVDRTNKQKSDFKLEDHSKKVKELVRESEKRINKENLEIKPKATRPIDKAEVKQKSEESVKAKPAENTPKPKVKEPVKEPEGGSFFDELED
ncbi:MAG: cell division initiation protein [Cyclobacteriaceae bacterium]|jgi:cell division initiation protein